MPQLAAPLLHLALAGATALPGAPPPGPAGAPSGPAALADADAADEAAAEAEEGDAAADPADDAEAAADDDAPAPAPEGPPPPEEVRVRPPAPVLRVDTLDRQRQAAIGLLVAAGVADLAAFALRGAHYLVLERRCAEDPALGELPADTRCPSLLALNVLGGSHTLVNVGLYALAIEGGKGLGRQRADRVKAGLAPPLDHARARRIALPIAYFTTVGAAVLGYLVFFDAATSPSPGTRLRAPPTRTPAFSPLLQFGTQAAMTVSAAWIAVVMRARGYRLRMDELEVSAAIGPTPGGASLGVFGRF